jgi:hypothetical protein
MSCSISAVDSVEGSPASGIRFHHFTHVGMFNGSGAVRCGDRFEREPQ